MNVLVCISRVPDTAAKINVGSDGKSLERSGIKFIINPFDEFAIEEGIRLKEKNGASTTVITVGSPDSKDILRTSLAMGIETAVLIKSDENADTFSVANDIANYAKETKPDLILMGKESIDYNSYQMASLLGGLLDTASISVVSKLSIDGEKINAERDIEGGKEIIESSLPCIISVQKGINEPRYPKLPQIMKAKKKPIDERNSSNTANRVEILSMEIPSSSRVGMIVGDSDSDMNSIVKALHEDAKVI